MPKVIFIRSTVSRARAEGAGVFGRRGRAHLDGRELFYRQGDAVMAVPELFRGSYRSLADPGSASFNYDVAPDGEHFVMIEKGPERGLAGELHVIVDWTAELERLVPSGK